MVAFRRGRGNNSGQAATGKLTGHKCKAKFNTCLAFDSKGNVLVSEPSHLRCRKTTSSLFLRDGARMERRVLQPPVGPWEWWSGLSTQISGVGPLTREGAGISPPQARPAGRLTTLIFQTYALSWSLISKRRAGMLASIQNLIMFLNILVSLLL